MSDDNKKDGGARPISDTGDRRIIDITGNDKDGVSGRVEPVTGKEAKPCCMCRSWEHDEKKVTEHLLAMGLEAGPDGAFTTPIAKDIPGRVSLKLHPKEVGYCRLEGTITQDLASCERFEPVRYASELASRIQRR